MSKMGVLIDPVLELVDRDFQLTRELGLKLRYIVNTHVHADHVTGSGKLKQLLKAAGNGEVQSVICKDSGAKADIHVLENDEVRVGQCINLKVLQTPGHTNGCLSLVENTHKLVFTGDALFIRGCGRTDFQGGSSAKLYDSIHTKLFRLPEDFLVFPAHDYKGHQCSTIGEEKQYNPRLTKSKEEFMTLMENLKLEKPKFIDVAVPRNLVCGLD